MKDFIFNSLLFSVGLTKIGGIKMKALTIWQPWASAIAFGLKQYETRGWSTSYRGPVAIHAAVKKVDSDLLSRLNRELFESGYKTGCEHEFLFFYKGNDVCIAYNGTYDIAEFGSIVAIAELVDCIRIDSCLTNNLSVQELILGDYTPGRYAWKFKNIKPLIGPNAIPCKGKQRLWNVDI